MNILIQLSHPAHFHLYKNVAQMLHNHGHKVLFAIKTKDILEELIRDAGYDYVNINAIAHRGSKLGVLYDMMMRDLRLMRICRQHHIDLITGSTPEVSHVGWLMRIHSINTGEDDAAIVPLFVKIACPFMQCILSPVSCNNGKMEPKSVKYPGYQKLAYLHPNRFTPDTQVVEKYGIDPHQPYFLMRFAKLNAHHDKGIQGFSTEVAQHIIDSLTPYGKVYITSERALEPQFESYRLNINPLDIHHVMAYATMYMGDSQSMAVEAAMLGVPSIRFNDFVGSKKIGVLEELEHQYGLTFGISSHEPDQLYNKVDELLHRPNLREEFQQRRLHMLSDKIDVTAFWTWFIEHYPQSVNQSRLASQQWWNQFK